MSERSNFNPSQPQVRRVRFDSCVQIYSEIPWSHESPPARVISPQQNDDDLRYPKSMKESIYALRMEIKSDEQTPVFGIVLLIICLLVLFCLIGFVVHRILLLEVDTEMGKHTNQRKFV
jgi:hypothetical protein